ncbi:MAG: Secretion system C-terminal sorting domain [Bacteroidetes bacterium]|jgi:hypothetical protein|nr:Secretion system C-terminal sorting domain [Bacteroidota bacterium]
MKLFFMIAVFGLCNCLNGQVTDYRDTFLGLYHTNTPPCVNANDQAPPNRYVLIEKDTTNSTSIIVYDTMWYDASPPHQYGYVHPCTLNQSDSSYLDGIQLGKFISNVTLRITGNCCGFGYNYYLQKLTPVGLVKSKDQLKEWYLFPNPAIHEFTILFLGQNEKITVSLLDIHGREWVHKNFKAQIHMDVNTLPRGLYIVRLTGKNLNLTRRLVLTE